MVGWDLDGGSWATDGLGGRPDVILLVDFWMDFPFPLPALGGVLHE